MYNINLFQNVIIPAQLVMVRIRITAYHVYFLRDTKQCQCKQGYGYDDMNSEQCLCINEYQLQQNVLGFALNVIIIKTVQDAPKELIEFYIRINAFVMMAFMKIPIKYANLVIIAVKLVMGMAIITACLVTLMQEEY
ncbi:hypothetical protein pb186bvf_021102 [Paramecium bursaria]